MTSIYNKTQKVTPASQRKRQSTLDLFCFLKTRIVALTDSIFSLTPLAQHKQHNHLSRYLQDQETQAQLVPLDKRLTLGSKLLLTQLHEDRNDLTSPTQSLFFERLSQAFGFYFLSVLVWVFVYLWT